MDHVVPELVAEQLLLAGRAGEVERSVWLGFGLCTRLAGGQVGQQEVSDQHEVQVACYTSVPQKLVVAQSQILLSWDMQNLFLGDRKCYESELGN